MLILSVLPVRHWALFMRYFCPPDRGWVLQENQSSYSILIRCVPFVTTWGVECRSSGCVTLHSNQAPWISLYSHRGHHHFYSLLQTGPPSSGTPWRENQQSHTELGWPGWALLPPGHTPADLIESFGGLLPQGLISQKLVDFQPSVHSHSHLNVEIRQSIHGAVAWLVLACCHFIYEVLVFDKRISFRHR